VNIYIYIYICVYFYPDKEIPEDGITDQIDGMTDDERDA